MCDYFTHNHSHVNDYCADNFCLGGGAGGGGGGGVGGAIFFWIRPIFGNAAIFCGGDGGIFLYNEQNTTWDA